MQVRLSQLGFNPGRIDGLFGPLLHEALSDFQRNCEIPVDGTLTRRTLFELERVTPSATDRTLISEVTEMTESPTAGPLILWGKTDLAVQVVARSTYVRGHDTAATIDLLPAAANDLDASGVLVFEETDGVEGIHLAYWSNYRSYSRRGEQLASQLAAAISRSPVHVRIHVEGMGLPVLRETRMTTLVLRHGGLTAADVDVLSDVIARSLTDFFHN